MIAKDEEIGRLQDENAKLEAHINAMEKNMARSSNELLHSATKLGKVELLK